MIAKSSSAHGIFKLRTLAVNWTQAEHRIRTFHIKVPTAESLLVALTVVSIIASLRSHRSRLVNSPRWFPCTLALAMQYNQLHG